MKADRIRMASIELHKVGAEEALARLVEGNRRFAAAGAVHPRQDPIRRAELVAAQRPFAAVVTCSDARVAPELVFDQGFGDLFVVRNGGNIADEIAGETLEFAVSTWGIELILVMGHQNCGAVAGTLAGIDSGAEPGRLFGEIRRAIAATIGATGDRLQIAVRANLTHTLARLAERPYFAELLTRGELTILGAYYSIEAGTVEIV
jgi:carbonic anhydrase